MKLEHTSYERNLFVYNIWFDVSMLQSDPTHLACTVLYIIIWFYVFILQSDSTHLACTVLYIGIARMFA